MTTLQWSLAAIPLLDPPSPRPLSPSSSFCGLFGPRADGAVQLLQLQCHAKVRNNEFLKGVIDGCITRIFINLRCYRTSLSPDRSCKRTVPFRGLIKTPLQFPPHRQPRNINLHYLGGLIRTAATLSLSPSLLLHRPRQ